MNQQTYPQQSHPSTTNQYQPRTVKYQHALEIRTAPPPRQWVNGICDITEDIGTFCRSICCPCVVYAQSNSRVEGKQTWSFFDAFIFVLLAPFTFILHGLLRSKIQRKSGMDVSLHFPFLISLILVNSLLLYRKHSVPTCSWHVSCRHASLHKKRHNWMN